ncbi:GNAT family N-acetyltransferase [Kribbella speibonae]|uniref:N-acetyltransferase n=1 Tax=Kribbella speibonae TaxID=1572660 RepID=A0ABY2A4Z8_9ACTN|nr:GNAT family N-acetyltransferase [Kribbella speibonae]TCC23509.1 N-acetyltransferase [Kribbella speibonae]
MFTTESTVPAHRIPELTDLMRTAWWMTDRTPAGIRHLLDHSDLVIAVTHQPTDQLVGFARVLTDYAYVALILDVIVAEPQRGTGVGAVLLDAVVTHPALTNVRSLELVCQPDLIPFYRRWGFTEQVGTSHLMRRTTDARLTTQPVADH